MRAAKECYTRALSDQPGLAVAWNNLGCVSLDEANGAEAIEYFTRAIYFDPVLECAYTNLVLDALFISCILCRFFARMLNDS